MNQHWHNDTGGLVAGLYRMPETVYRALPALNWSTIKHAATSPAEAKRRHDNPKPSTSGQARERLVHALVLDPEASLSEFVQAPFPAFTTNAAKAWKKAKIAEGLSPVSPRGWKDAEASAATIRRHRLVAAILDRETTHGELVAIWRQRVPLEGGEGGEVVEVWCKCRADVAMFEPAGVRVADLKAGSTTDPDGFLSLDVARHLYHGQLDMYGTGIISAMHQAGDPRPSELLCPFWIVHSGADVVCIRANLADEDHLGDTDLSQVQRAGRALWQRALRRYVSSELSAVWDYSLPDDRAHAASRWPGHAPGRSWDTWEEEAERADAESASPGDVVAATKEETQP